LNLKSNLEAPSIVLEQSSKTPELTNAPGFRAAEAYVRPSPISTVGRIIQSGFDLRSATFTFRLHANKVPTEDEPTEIFLPEFHFPQDRSAVEVSGGKWAISADDEHGNLIQKLKWWHPEGEHHIKVTGVRSRQNGITGKEDEEGYLEQCQQSSCSVM
jgi:Glycoside hydrolase family 5 C-terminal domain